MQKWSHSIYLSSSVECYFQQEQRDGGDEEDETMSKTSQSQPNPHFHNVALKYLDQYAPVWGMLTVVLRG